MSEIQTKYCLKYKDGRYLSWSEKEYPLTKYIRRARRFGNVEQIADFLQNSFYRPESEGLSSADFEITEFEIEYREVEPSERLQTDLHAGLE